MSKRKQYSTWEQAFLKSALAFASRSKDPSTQVGAVIADKDNRFLSEGYNGTPRGLDDDNFYWGKDNDNHLHNKYAYVIHAERNAVLNFRGSLSQMEGGTVYVTHSPCHECLKELIQVGISKVVYLEEYPDEYTDEMVRLGLIELEKYSGEL